ncbi:MAG TPA: response regulator [Solirubrobacteraceae bacterium]|nr:response regulator [Solirubrobacteraceae bacterium]
MASPDRPIAVLLVDDDQDDYIIARDLLAGQERVRFRLDWCSNYSDGLATIGQRRHDVYLIDYRLGALTGLELIREVSEAGRRSTSSRWKH